MEQILKTNYLNDATCLVNEKAVFVAAIDTPTLIPTQKLVLFVYTSTIAPLLGLLQPEKSGTVDRFLNHN